MREIIFDKFQFPHLSSPIMHSKQRILFFVKTIFRPWLAVRGCPVGTRPRPLTDDQQPSVQQCHSSPPGFLYRANSSNYITRRAGPLLPAGTLDRSEDIIIGSYQETNYISDQLV